MSNPDYSDSDLKRQRSEAIYLAGLLVVSTIALLAIWIDPCGLLEKRSKLYFFSAIGGFLGGWALDVKWFYRVTARGKDNQHKHPWERHKIYWRIFLPFLSGVVALAFYSLASSELVQIINTRNISGRGVFGLSFLFGYFSDATVVKMSELFDCLLGNKRNSDQ